MSRLNKRTNPVSAFQLTKLISEKFICLFLLLSLLQSTFRNVEGAKTCVATAENRYLCTDDAAKALASKWKNAPDNTFDYDSLDLGVKQEIAGSEAEKEKILNVLKEMREYIEQEVYVKSEYDSVIGKCKNRNKLCAFWASIGECENNRKYMMESCAASCRMCLALLSKSV